MKEQSKKAIRLQGVVFSGDDPEALHDLRVAVRRARRGVQTFAAFLPVEAASLEQPLHELFHRLGEVRDLDIALSMWTDLVGEEVVERLQALRREAKSRLTNVSSGWDALARLAEIAVGKPAGSSLSAAPVEAVAPDLLESAFKAAQRVAGSLEESASVTEIHLLRRRAKRLRDVLGFFVPFYRLEARRLGKGLKRLQDQLGEHQDLVIVRQILAGIEGLSEESKTSLDRALESLERKREGLRAEILDQASGFGGDEWKELKKCMIRTRRQLWTGAINHQVTKSTKGT